MSPLIKPVGLIGGTLLLLLIGRKTEAAPLPPPGPLPPPTPPPPAPKPPGPAPVQTASIPLGRPGDFAAGALVMVVRNEGVRLRAAASETSASLGTMARGTLLEVFPNGHQPPTPAAPQGWEGVRAANGVQGFIAAQFLTGEGAPRGGTETPNVEPIIPIEQAPEIGGLPGFSFAGLPAAGSPGSGWFSPMVGASAPAYGQTQFVRPLPRLASDQIRSYLAYARRTGASPAILRALEGQYRAAIAREGVFGTMRG